MRPSSPTAYTSLDERPHTSWRLAEVPPGTPVYRSRPVALLEAGAALRRALIPQGVRDRIKASRQMRQRPEMSPATRARLTLA